MGRARLATVDLRSSGRDDPPGSAELIEALAAELAALAVGDVVVEGVPAVGHLERPVRAPCRAEERVTDAGAGVRLCFVVSGGQRAALRGGRGARAAVRPRLRRGRSRLSWLASVSRLCAAALFCIALIVGGESSRWVLVACAAGLV